MIGIREVHHVDAALIPALHHDVAARHRNQAAVVRHAVLLRRLRRRNLEVARAACTSCSASIVRMVLPPISIMLVAWHIGPRAAAPLIGEHDLLAVVAEHRRVPEREVGVGPRRRVAPASRDSRCRPASRSSRRRRRGGASPDTPSRRGSCAGRSAAEPGAWCRAPGRRDDRRGTPRPRSRRGRALAPASRPVKMRAPVTTAACSGCASGTLMMSSRYSEFVGSAGSVPFLQPASSVSGRAPCCPDT